MKEGGRKKGGRTGRGHQSLSAHLQDPGVTFVEGALILASWC